MSDCATILGPMTKTWPLDGSVASSWAGAPHLLRRAGVALSARTCTVAVATWVGAQVHVPVGVHPALATVAGGGVAWDDLVLFSRVCLRGGSIPDDAAVVLNAELRTGFAQHSPGMPVRDALGWMLVAAQRGQDTRVLMRSWAPGSANSGWVFVAAGLCPAEADRLTVRQALVMAGLRGTFLPVG